ncbi:MAG: hypothetical protein WCY32_05185 [Burkholderiaceae bacterium]
MFTIAGLAVTALACLCLYAASPNQKLWATAWPARPARVASAGLLMSAWLAFVRDMQYLTATFTLLTTLMLVLVVLPYVGAWRHARRAH